MSDPIDHETRRTPTHARRRRSRFGAALALAVSLFLTAVAAPADETPRPVPDPSARLLSPDDASEYWTIYVELDSGHRISQRFALTNAGPGEHTAVAVGHLMEPGRAPYRYANGRRRSRWTLSDDRLFFDIAASHLDLHRPTGELRITKDDIEIRLFFDFSGDTLAAAVPSDFLPPHYGVEVLAVATPTRGSVHAPWMEAPIQTSGRLWMSHTWAFKDEAKLVDRRVEIYGAHHATGAAHAAGADDAASGLETADARPEAFFGLNLSRGGTTRVWSIARDARGRIIESSINEPESWSESRRAPERAGSRSYPLSGDFQVAGPRSGSITLGGEFLRFDPLEVIPNPFRWFIRRMTQPQEVWADAMIDGTLFSAPATPSLPTSVGANESEIADRSNGSGTRTPSERETGNGSAERRVAGVAFITFMNPTDRR